MTRWLSLSLLSASDLGPRLTHFFLVVYLDTLAVRA